jgi:acetate kinase
MKILVLNAGSSSQKCSLFQIGDSIPAAPPDPLWQAEIDWSGAGAAGSELRLENSSGAKITETVSVTKHTDAIGMMLEQRWTGPARAVASARDLDVVGHRVVHGGADLVKPTRVTPEVKNAILKLSELAPLHNRIQVDCMNAVEKQLGEVPQVAVFDTAFHAHMPIEAAVYPGPYEWLGEGIRRYGFHGINHQYCAERAWQILKEKAPALRLISCHLGNGCSLAAIRGGRSVDTTMGFTPIDGIMMGTRSGSVDPGILIYLMHKHGSNADELDQTLNRKSGLLGISGLSNDMREILSAKNRGNQRAALAFDIFIHRLRSGIGAMLAALGGLDALIFTAGIGENSPDVRFAACAAFDFLGIRLDQERNLLSPKDQDIATSDSRVRVLIIRAQEDWAIARDCWKLVTGSI